MIQWEYYAFLDDSQIRMDRINELGREGWELISFSNSATICAIFKRPIPKDEPKQQLND
jgi:hypothetical protein